MYPICLLFGSWFAVDDDCSAPASCGAKRRPSPQGDVEIYKWKAIDGLSRNRLVSWILSKIDSWLFSSINNFNCW